MIVGEVHVSEVREPPLLGGNDIVERAKGPDLQRLRVFEERADMLCVPRQLAQQPHLLRLAKCPNVVLAEYSCGVP